MLKDEIMSYKVTVLGAGLAGCEAALWLAGKGVQVTLYEQKPTHFSPAHKSAGFAELICSNSLKAERLDSASGLLKEEMRRMGSQLLEAAEEARVAAGGALAVDRDAFSAAVTRRVEECPNITVVREQVEHIDESAPILVATGPLTDGALADEIGRLTGDERLHFYDAVAPIVTAESLDYNKVFAASRYDRGEADYLNCPFNKAEYEAFHAALASAERAPLHAFDAGAEQGAQPDPDAHGKKADTVTVYEGCMPIEIMAARGADTMRFGPLRPVGLVDPNTGHRPWANVQLRAENKERTLYNIVGFQTNLKWGEQKRVFSMIPGLENAEFVRYGVMHRNTFLDAPRVLDAGLFLKEHPNVFFAGHSPAHRGQHGAIRAQLPGIQLRVAAGQIEPVDLLRQGGVLQGAEPAELRPRPLQCFQRFGVGEAKRRIPCNGNGNAGALFLCSLGRQLSRKGEPICVHQRRCALGQSKKLFPIHHQRIGHPADLLL